MCCAKVQKFYNGSLGPLENVIDVGQSKVFRRGAIKDLLTDDMKKDVYTLLGAGNFILQGKRDVLQLTLCRYIHTALLQRTQCWLLFNPVLHVCHLRSQRSDLESMPRSIPSACNFPEMHTSHYLSNGLSFN